MSGMIEHAADRIRLYGATAASEIQAAQMYRVNFLFSLVCDFVPLLGVLYLWAGMGPEELYGYGRAQLIAYYLLSALISSWFPTVWDEVGDNIRDGTLTAYLLRPLSYYWHYFSLTLGSNLVYASMGLLLLGPIALGALAGVWGAALSDSPAHWMAFLLLLALGFVLHFTLGFCVQLLSFWLDRVRGITSLWGVLSALLGGAYFPLDFLPPQWLEVTRLLPFYYARFLPLRAATGAADGGEIAAGLGVLALWVAAAWVIMGGLWARGVRTYSAPGG